MPEPLDAVPRPFFARAHPAWIVMLALLGGCTQSPPDAPGAENTGHADHAAATPSGPAAEPDAGKGADAPVLRAAAAATVPASSRAPWPVLQRVDALTFTSRVGLTSAYGDYWERSEEPFDINYRPASPEIVSPATGGSALYANLDLGSGADSLILRVSVPSGPVRVEVRLGAVDGPLVGSCTLATTGPNVYRTVNCPVNASQVRGRQTLAFVLKGAMRLNWFAFWARDTTQNIDQIQKVQSTQAVNRPAPSRPLAGTPPRTRALLPPAGAALARSYGQWSPSSVGECPKWLHDTHWVRGDDTKVYPTWHPPVDYNPETGMYCSYGHEHGDDPRGSEAFDVAGMPPFGSVSERHSTANPALQRHEDHLGHKVLVANNWQMYAPDGGGTRSCDVTVKVHMGTHSPDALVNTAHEMFLSGRCDGLQPFDLKQFGLFGAPGSFREPQASLCSNFVTPALTPNPAGQPSGGIHRAIPTLDCYARGTADERLQHAWKRSQEFWLTNSFMGGSFYFTISNPGRVYDPAAATKISRTVDLCYTPGHPLALTLACQETVAASPTRVAWNDPRSAFRGTAHFNTHFSGLEFRDSAANVLYTDVYGKQGRPTPDASRDITVKQRVPTAGFRLKVDGGASVFPRADYSADGKNGVHAPN